MLIEAGTVAAGIPHAGPAEHTSEAIPLNSHCQKPEALVVVDMGCFAIECCGMEYYLRRDWMVGIQVAAPFDKKGYSSVVLAGCSEYTGGALEEQEESLFVSGFLAIVEVGLDSLLLRSEREVAGLFASLGKRFPKEHDSSADCKCQTDYKTEIAIAADFDLKV